MHTHGQDNPKSLKDLITIATENNSGLKRKSIKS